jgi:hypothetical protein
MEESLRSWLHIAFDDVVKEYKDGITDIDDNEKVRLLGLFIFSLSEESSFEDVFEEMTSYFGRDLSHLIQSCPIFPIEACLLCAVSSLSFDRTRFVQAIMSMEPTAQAHIMGSIQNNLQHYFDVDQSENEEDDDNFSIDRPFHRDSNTVDELILSDGAKCTGETLPRAVDSSMNSNHRRENVTNETNYNQGSNFCIHCDVNGNGYTRLKQDLESVIKREKEGEAKLRVEITSQTNKLIDAEIIIIDRDDKLSKQAMLLDNALNVIQENEEKMLESCRVMNQLQVIQDEIDVLKPKADKADASEQQLEKLRSRLDELKGIKQQLKTESIAHAETHSKLIQTEQELESLRKAKVLVEEYRTQCAETAIQLGEQSCRLRQRDLQVQQLEEDCTFLRGGQQDQRLQTQHLNDELQEANKQLREDRIGGLGVGEGMSELNPALMKELQSLRANNEELQYKLNASSIESLDLLSKNLEDQRCINSSLQEKWMNTKDSLATAFNNIAKLDNKLATLNSDYHCLQGHFIEFCGMSGEEVQSVR